MTVVGGAKARRLTAQETHRTSETSSVALVSLKASQSLVSPPVKGTILPSVGWLADKIG